MLRLTLLLTLFTSFAFGQCDTLFFDIGEAKPVDNTGLLLHYSFESNCNDLSGNGHDAVQFTGNYTAGTCGLSAQFNGTDFIEIPDAARLRPLQSTSIAFWMKTSQTSRFDLIDQRTGSWSVDAHNFGLYFNCCGIPQNIHYNHPNYNQATKETTLEVISNNFNNNEWHFMVFVKDVAAQTMKIYQDGCLISERTITDINYNIDGSLFIGKHFTNTNYFTGLLDEFRIYNRALSEDDIERLKYLCAPLDVQLAVLNTTCQTCVINPQNDLTYHLLDSTNTIIESIDNTCSNAICFTGIAQNTLVQVESQATGCMMLLNPNLIADCLSIVPNSTTEIEPTCTPHIEMPNVFTPNGDEMNDLFKIIKMDCATPESLLIMNRWGQSIFDSKSSFQWDGRTSDGVSASDGLYIWILTAKDVDGNEMKRKGVVELLR